MNKNLCNIFFLICIPCISGAQITTPQIRASFGVDGDLRSQYFNSAVQLGNDDWFNQKTGTADTGRFIIDTTGAAALAAQYVSDPASRKLPIYRNMRYPQYSVVNNVLLLDAVMIRDYHGDDSTVFATGGNKNGDSPDSWSCPVSQGIPDKNDILDMFLHVRRAGPSSSDSLWMFGGLSLDNTTGNRYFDFEMYQTDIYYDRGTRKFYGFGPDAGHTRWQFDASGNVTVPGDIIFNAQYQSASLTAIEARIWVHVSALSITPAQFNWSGEFDGGGSGATYGYASIVPKSSGAYFTGLQCSNNTWGGPFPIVLQNNALATNYLAGQFVEFSVNLTQLGLDPVTLMGGSVCGMPFRRMLVKTRSSSAFTSELKDFVGPFDLFLAPRVQVQTNTPSICDMGSAAQIIINNPSPSSVYEWSTPNGNIVGPTNGTSIVVDTPGVYWVRQSLQAGCPVYAADTLQIFSFGNCVVLGENLQDFQGRVLENRSELEWQWKNAPPPDYFEVEQSSNGNIFTVTGKVGMFRREGENLKYHYSADLANWNSKFIYYRLKFRKIGNKTEYSPVIRLDISQFTKKKISISPNPVSDKTSLRFEIKDPGSCNLYLVGMDGKTYRVQPAIVQRGWNHIYLKDLENYPRGIYQLQIRSGSETLIGQLVLSR